MTEVPGNTVAAEHKFRPFEVSLESDELAVRGALAAVLRRLAPLDLSAEEESTIELVLAEALNNIVEHAYPDDVSDGLIEINCTYECGGLNVHIIDSGKSLPDETLPLGHLASLDVDLNDLPEGGFGWFLIRNLAKAVTYDRVNDQNILKLRLSVGPGN